MKEKLQLAVNLWYSEWLLTHDPFENNFQSEIEASFDVYDCKFIYDLTNDKWILV